MPRPVTAILVAVWLAMAPAVMADPGDVVSAARSRIGSPYAWGATGPDRFDCSGLVVWSFARAGIAVPRTSQQQAAGGTAVARDELQPGDVIAYYPGATHVGLYVGDGQVIHASTYGRPVAEVPIDAAGPFRNARRYLRKKADPMPATTFDYGITRVMHGFNPNTGPNCTGNSNGPRARTLFVVFHTQEGDGTAVSLANFLNGTRDRSYNLTIDDNDTVEVVPVNEGPWAAMDANSIAVHICIAGSRAAWTAEQWMKRSKSLDRAAKAAAAACRQYGIPAVWALSSGGWPSTPSGLAGHVDFGVRGGGHHDPGPYFPKAYVANKVMDLLETPTRPPTTSEVPVENPDQVTDLHRQILGRWEMLGWRTPVEALAVLLDAATGSSDAGKTGWKAL